MYPNVFRRILMIKIIYKIFKQFLRPIKNNDKSVSDSNKNSSWFTIPFVNTIWNKFKRIVNNIDSKISFYSMNKLCSLIKVQKDLLSNNSQRNVVYRISYKDWCISYVGQTDRQLRTRISEHRNHIGRKTSIHSVIIDPVIID